MAASAANGVTGTSVAIRRLQTGHASVAMDINDAGRVAGRSLEVNGLSTPDRGYVWDSTAASGTLPINLGFFGSYVAGGFPLAINNSGVIVVYAVDRTLGRYFGFRWVLQHTERRHRFRLLSLIAASNPEYKTTPVASFGVLGTQRTQSNGPSVRLRRNQRSHHYC